MHADPPGVVARHVGPPDAGRPEGGPGLVDVFFDAPPPPPPPPPSAPPPPPAPMPAGGRVPMPRTVDQWHREIAAWLDPSRWPTPRWAAAPARGRAPAGPAGGRAALARWAAARRASVGRYEASVLHQLRVRYLDLELDLRTVCGNYLHGWLGDTPLDVVTGEQAVALLHTARGMLERDDPDPMAAASLLDLVERSLVWLTPAYMLAARVPGIARRLEAELAGAPRGALAPLLARLAGVEEAVAADRPLHEVRSVVEEAIAVTNAAAAERQIAGGLQLARLSILRDRGLLLLGATLAALPLLVPAGAPPPGTAAFPVALRLLGVPAPVSDAWLAGGAVALVGAVGGSLSGLLQARASAVSAAEYQDSVLRLQLRPAVGATVALVLFVLLSWGIVPGVAVTSAGTYLLVAFVSGFSERYFLRLLDLDDVGEAAGRAAALPRVAVADGAGPAAGTRPDRVGAYDRRGAGRRRAAAAETDDAGDDDPDDTADDTADADADDAAAAAGRAERG